MSGGGSRSDEIRADAGRGTPPSRGAFGGRAVP